MVSLTSCECTISQNAVFLFFWGGGGLEMFSLTPEQTDDHRDPDVKTGAGSGPGPFLRGGPPR